MAFKILSQKDWLRGLNAATGKATKIDGTVIRISNLMYTKRGSLITVDGTKLISQDATWKNSGTGFGATATPVAMIAANKSPAAPFPLVVALDFGGAWRAYDFSQNPPIKLLQSGISTGGAAGTISAIIIDAPGSGYTSATNVILSTGGFPPPNISASLSVTIGAGAITSVNLVAPNFGGSGYAAPPIVSFVDPGGGTGAAAHCVMGINQGTWGGILPYQPGKVPVGVFRLPQLVNVGNTVVLCPGNDGIPVWANFFNGQQGSVGSNPASYPVGGAAHGILHQGFLWLWNTGQNIGPVDSPSTLRMCELGSNGLPDITTFPQVNAAFVDANDGTQGQGCASFTSASAGISPTATLVLFKDYKTYQVTGLLRPGGGYTVTKAQTEMGCVAPRSIEFAPGFGIMRLTHLGVAVFDGTNDKLVSEEIRPYLFPTESDITPIDWERAQFSKATITMNPPGYSLAVPVINVPGNSRVLFYDLIMRQWTVTDFPTVSSSTALGPILLIETIKIPNTRVITYISDYAPLNLNFVSLAQPLSQGSIRRWLYGDPDWDGVAINWSVKPPYMFAKATSAPLYIRRNILRAKAPNSTVVCRYDIDGVQTRVRPISKSFRALTARSIYGSASYGYATYGDAYPDLVLPFDVGVRAFSIAPKYSGSGIIELLATDWHFIEKPEVPYPRVS